MAKKKVVKASSKKAVKKKQAKKAVKAVSPVKAASSKKGKKKKDDLMCFLTTACVQYYGLPDDCYELNSLRNYRDRYLMSSKGGTKLVMEYYQVAPVIVGAMQKDDNCREAYSFIYWCVKDACRFIENGKNVQARNIYSNMVEVLKKRYLI
jgi:hypothetical protein